MEKKQYEEVQMNVLITKTDFITTSGDGQSVHDTDNVVNWFSVVGGNK